MFEKISNAAERLATNVSESRRGFLVRMGQAALGVAGGIGGFLALPKEAHAFSSITNGCLVIQSFNSWTLTGACIDKRSGECRHCVQTAQCPIGSHVPASASLCGYHVTTVRACHCQ